MTKYNEIEVWLVNAATSPMEFIKCYSEKFPSMDNNEFAIRVTRIWLQRKRLSLRIERAKDKYLKCKNGMLVAGNGKKLKRRW